MRKLNLLVVGLGSMGKRRIRLLLEHFSNNVLVAGVDIKQARRNEVMELYNIKTYANLDEAIKIEKPIGVLVCTSPITHADIILKCIDYKLHVFTELNLLKDKYELIMERAKINDIKLFLSSTFLYRKETQFIQEKVHSNKKKFHYRYHVGQYLPDWHPWESYKDFFVNNKHTNGCREIFAIELPWIIKTFGKITQCYVSKDHLSSLDLDYPDSYLVMLEHEHGHKGTLHVDVVSRKAVRNLEVYSEDTHLFWDGTPNSLIEYDVQSKETKQIQTYLTINQDKRYAENIIENAYLEELEIFIKKILEKDHQERYTFAEDLYTLKIIDSIEGVVE